MAEFHSAIIRESYANHTWARGRTVRPNPRRKLAKIRGDLAKFGKILLKFTRLNYTS